MSNFAQELQKNKSLSMRQNIEEVMDKESYKDYQEALANSSVSNASIARALKVFNINVSENTIRRWRKDI